MRFPTVNLNGTSAASLVEDLCDASTAITDALSKLQQCSPHGRDYPQGTSEWKAAVEEHRTRCAALDKVRQELNLIAEHIQGSAG